MIPHASSGFSITLPNVCVTPTPASNKPLPYPNYAKTALKSQQQSQSGATATKTPVATKAPVGTATLLGTKEIYYKQMGSVASSGLQQSTAVSSEAAQLRSGLTALNSRLQALQSNDPNVWQQLLQDYAVTAAALYVTLHGGG